MREGAVALLSLSGENEARKGLKLACNSKELQRFVPSSKVPKSSKVARGSWNWSLLGGTLLVTIELGVALRWGEVIKRPWAQGGPET